MGETLCWCRLVCQMLKTKSEVDRRMDSVKKNKKTKQMHSNNVTSWECLYSIETDLVRLMVHQSLKGNLFLVFQPGPNLKQILWGFFLSPWEVWSQFEVFSSSSGFNCPKRLYFYHVYILLWLTNTPELPLYFLPGQFGHRLRCSRTASLFFSHLFVRSSVF